MISLEKLILYPVYQYYEDCKKEGYQPLTKIAVGEKEILEMKNGWHITGVSVDNTPHKNIIVFIERDGDD